MKKIRYIAEFFGAIIILPVLLIIPYKLRIIIGGHLGIFVYNIYKKRRQIAFKNIVKSFPESEDHEHHLICRESFRHFGISIAEYIQLIKFNDKFIDKYITIEGEEFLKKALSEGRGLIGICPHLGNWEYIAAGIALKGYPLSVIMKRQSNPFINSMIERLRRSFNMELIYKSNSGFPVLKALKRNRIVAFVADQDAGRNGIFVDFLGRPASTAQGPARFALACKSPASICSGIRENNGKIKIFFSPFLKFDYESGKERESVYKNTWIWTKEIEEVVRKYPEQYFWMHRRWKTQENSKLSLK